MIQKTLAIVPAKGASTRLSRKNIRDLAGKPLIAWTIEAAKTSGIFDKVVVSSEDQLILQIATLYGAIPQPRPDKLAIDPAGCIDVAQYVLEELKKNNDLFDQIAILMPTCPFRTASDIRAAFQIRERKEKGCVISVSPFSHTPHNALIIDQDNLLQPMVVDSFGRKTQDQPNAYRPNGAIFIMDRETLVAADSLFPSPIHPHIMPAIRSIDIDNQLDLDWAEFLLEKNLVPGFSSSS